MLNAILLAVQLNLQQELFLVENLSVEKNPHSTKIVLDKNSILLQKNTILYNSKPILENCKKTSHGYFPKSPPVRFSNVLELSCDDTLLRLILPNITSKAKEEDRERKIPSSFFEKIPRQNTRPSLRYYGWQSTSPQEKEKNPKTLQGMAQTPPISRGLLWKKIRQENRCGSENYTWGICQFGLAPVCLGEELICY